MKRISLDETVSTNRYARELPEDQNHGLTLVTAEFQTAGRGAGTNKWESERGGNLLFSIVAYPRQLQAGQMFSLSEVTALAICDTLNGYADGFLIKWPNDIYHADSKAVGMLIENDLQGKLVRRSVIGIGVNINQTLFRSDAPNPVSLAQILGHREERNQVLDRIIQQFIYYYGMMEEGRYAELHRLYMQQLYRKDEFHQYADDKGTFTARIIDVEPTGHLILEDKDKQTRRYAFKEVRFI